MAGAALWRQLKAYQVFGANTDVGKTIISSALCKYLAESQSDPVWYLKPIQTGDIYDTSHVKNFTSSGTLSTQHLIHYPRPASPHVSARMPGCKPVSDEKVASLTFEALNSYAGHGPGWAIVETAGGVLSPGPSKSLQADIYRPLRLPSLLIADPKLGGISSTISSFESLKMRGYDVTSIITFLNSDTENHAYFKEYFDNTVVLPPPPPISNNDRASMQAYYNDLVKMPEFSSLARLLDQTHTDRLSELDNMSTEAEKTIWYPFSQHNEINRDTIVTVDSAYKDSYQTLRKGPVDHNENTLASSFDGSASWWTQGLGHGNPKLALTAAHAAGRYGHMILANTIHEPALKLAKKILEVVKNDKLRRVFYSDNGSTGIEVAVKMAMKATCEKYGWDVSDGSIGVLGLKRSYHGDTIGSMDCSEPSVYSKKVTWYTGRGAWLEYPTVSLKNGKWVVESPEPLNDELDSKVFSKIDEVYDLSSRDSGPYKEYIRKEIQNLLNKGLKFGALLLEPALLGAGGMVAVDPLFQKALVDVVRDTEFGKDVSSDGSSWSGLPVICDEVFSGLYRLGRASSSSLVGIDPDISVHAKLLTGGLLPLSVTLASEDIFQTFISSDKADALLHGHSYTAHPVGCAVALESLEQLQSLASSWGPENSIVSFWSDEFLSKVSNYPNVEGAFAMGSVLAIHMKDTSPGYTSTVASRIHNYLRTIQNGENIHTRPLGSVLYLMCGLTTTQEDVRKLEKKLEEAFS